MSTTRERTLRRQLGKNVSCRRPFMIKSQLCSLQCHTFVWLIGPILLLFTLSVFDPPLQQRTQLKQNTFLLQPTADTVTQGQVVAVSRQHNVLVLWNHLFLHTQCVSTVSSDQPRVQLLPEAVAKRAVAGMLLESTDGHHSGPENWHLLSEVQHAPHTIAKSSGVAPRLNSCTHPQPSNCSQC